MTTSAAPRRANAPLPPPVAKPLGGLSAELNPPKESLEATTTGTAAAHEVAKPQIDRGLQREIFVTMCANVDHDALATPGTTTEKITTLYQHIRGLSEIAAHQFGDGTGKK